jgi:hypothetical protein
MVRVDIFISNSPTSQEYTKSQPESAWSFLFLSLHSVMHFLIFFCIYYYSVLIHPSTRMDAPLNLRALSATVFNYFSIAEKISVVNLLLHKSVLDKNLEGLFSCSALHYNGKVRSTKHSSILAERQQFLKWGKLTQYVEIIDSMIHS